jgi:hypothetical protein
MAITTTAELKTAITSWLDIAASNLTNQITDLITLGENRIFREARTTDMETALSAAIAAGVLALPTSYVALKNAYVNTTPTVRLERKPWEWIYDHYPRNGSTGIPRYIAREGTNFIFGPAPDSTYTIKGIYYKRLAAIAGSVNALFTANPDLYLFACLAESEVLIGRDSRIAIWEAKYEKILSLVNKEAKNEESSGSTLAVSLG